MYKGYVRFVLETRGRSRQKLELVYDLFTELFLIKEKTPQIKDFTKANF